MLPGFNEEKLLEEMADEVREKTPEMADELGQEVAELGQEATEANATLEMFLMTCKYFPFFLYSNNV